MFIQPAIIIGNRAEISFAKLQQLEKHYEQPSLLLIFSIFHLEIGNSNICLS